MRWLLPLLLLACTDAASTRATLHSAGYTDVTTGDYDWFACSDSDAFSTTFTAKNPLGQTVSGVVCCGWTKACTVRF